MNLEINTRGNGVCPDCALLGRCPIHESLKNSIADIKPPHDMGMETVIYACPDFTPGNP
ncbi:MAG: hypothetical protein ACLFRY_09295 [Spirochaetia bacterium]